MAFLDISLETANYFYTWGWKLSLIGAATTAVGVALLMWGTRVRDHDFESQVGKLHLTAAQLEKESVEDRKKAAESQLEIEKTKTIAAQATARAAEANKKAEEERLARVKIEERLADRSLSPMQQESIAKKLSSFSGRKVNMVALSSSSEVTKIANQILAALIGAKWLVKTEVGSDFARSFSGILIETMPDADHSEIAAATAIAESLRAENLVVIGPIPFRLPAMSGTFSGERFPDGKILLSISTK